ncbi:MAG: TRAP transporter substrate-binding protein DctP [Polyangiaceae bacterium]|jgi:TRAP-type mannitol/chloroaromatic compound transport system substrate-binding protein
MTDRASEHDRRLIDRRGVVNAIAGLGATALAACGRATAAVKADEPSPSGAVVRWKAQGSDGPAASCYEPFVKFCSNVSELSEGKFVIEPHGPGEIVAVREMFDAVKRGKLDLAVTFPGFVEEFVPGTNFLTSYPLGLDRPDQWETWYYELGGLDLARKMFEPHGLFFLAPIQHDLNLIHSRIPIRSFDDFKGIKIRMPGGLIGEVFEAVGAKTAFLTGDQVYPTLQGGAIDAADFAGPATNFNLGFANVAKYIILGPPATPCIHQPVDLHCAFVSSQRWDALPKHLQRVLEYAVRRYSWDDYAYVQRQNILAWEKYRQKGVEILRLSNEDVDKLRRVAIPLWFKWARKDPLAREAFASQLAYMKNPSVGYLTDEMLVDGNGDRLAL